MSSSLAQTELDALVEMLSAEQNASARLQLDAVADDVNALSRKANKRKGEIESALELIKALIDDLKQCQEQIEGYYDHSALQDNNGTAQVRQIREQQEALRALNTELEPLHKRQGALVTKARELQRSAGEGVNTAALETAANGVADAWSELQQRVKCFYLSFYYFSPTFRLPTDSRSSTELSWAPAITKTL